MGNGGFLDVCCDFLQAHVVLHFASSGFYLYLLKFSDLFVRLDTMEVNRTIPSFGVFMMLVESVCLCVCVTHQSKISCRC